LEGTELFLQINKMKKTSILLLFLALYSSIVLGQKYVEYNVKIISAQQFALDGKLDSALIIYKVAFELVPKPFPKDLENAAVSAYYLDSLDLMEFYIQQSIEYGASLKYVKKRFKRFNRSSDFWKRMKAASVDYSQKIESQNDTLYLALKDMFIADQKARKSNFNKMDKMLSADSLNQIKLNVIVSKYEYPGYISLGIFKSITIIDVLLLHLPIDDYEEYVINGMINGEVTPHLAWYIICRQYQYHNKTVNHPENAPPIIDKCLRYYKGDRYENLCKKGFDFIRIL
jgi:hypothetical protein